MIESLTINSPQELNKISAIIPTHYHSLASDPDQLIIHSAHVMAGTQGEIYICPRPLHITEPVSPVRFKFVVTGTVRQTGVQQAVWVQVDSA